MEDVAVNDEEQFPVQPAKPLESECCGTGCSPCVFDIYEKQLKKWEDECKKIREKLKAGAGELENAQENCSLTPEKYLYFELISVNEDAPSANIYRFRFIPLAEGKGTEQNRTCLNFSNQDLIEVGQHVVIKIGTEAKPYTVLGVGLSNDGPYFDILIRIYPKGLITPSIGKLVPGDSVLIRGPFGRVFHWKSSSYKTVIMFAAGTGIAPMYRIIETILNNEDDNTKIKLIYCNRSVDSILLKSKLREWASFWNFLVVHYLTRNGNLKIPYGMKVRLKKFTYSDFCESCSDQIDKSFFLVCGTKSFEKDIINYMKRAKVPPERQNIF